MALIKCPECEKEISDKANICVNCGFPIQDYLIEQEKEIKEQNEIVKESKIDVCPFCDSDDIDNDGYCNECGMLVFSKKDIISERISDKRNLLIVNGANRIEICNGKLRLEFPTKLKIEDYIWNFSLEYFAISMGVNVGLLINNTQKNYTSGVIDIICTRKTKGDFLMFKDIMENNGLYKKRNRFDALYMKTEEEKEILENHKKLFNKIMDSSEYEKKEFKGVYRYVFGQMKEVYCPRCGSENCVHYKEQRMIPGKTKTRYTVNLNPLKPFTLVNKKEKVIKNEEIVTENKFTCNDCGKIFY